MVSACLQYFFRLKLCSNCVVNDGKFLQMANCEYLINLIIIMIYRQGSINLQYLNIMFNKISEVDKAVSRPLIKLDNLFVTILLYPFAAFFHPKLIFLAYFSVYWISGTDKYATIIYLIGTGICLITTTILKKILNRPRPQLCKQIKKPSSFRRKQKNNSMPSGDSIQSALFVAYLYFLMHEQGIFELYWYRIIGLVLFHIGVCCGRVYYMCHWFGDTLVATILGIFVGIMINSFRICGQNKIWMQQILGGQL